MDRILLLAFFLQGAFLSAQKIDGVYYGEIVSPKNVLVVSVQGDKVNGIVYLNEKDSVNLKGEHADRVLTGKIRVDGKKIELSGTPERNAMWLVILPDTSRRFLNKISNKVSYKISKLFSSTHDPMLSGRWELIKSVDKFGNESDGKNSVTYDLSGNSVVQIIKIPSNVRRNEFMTDTQLLSMRMPGKWETLGDDLVETKMIGPNEMISHSRYIVRKDTLFIYLNNRGEQPDKGCATFKKK